MRRNGKPDGKSYRRERERERERGREREKEKKEYTRQRQQLLSDVRVEILPSSPPAMQAKAIRKTIAIPFPVKSLWDRFT